MLNETKILTILASPHKQKSNTLAFVEDFVDEMKKAGLNLKHNVISLREKRVDPCRGCWNCTDDKPCPIKDDLEEIKEAMINCDMLILASPVYTNLVTAQMKALFDRLFTWCHIFPLLGKYSLSACTTGNDGIKPTTDFMEKMLATYGTFSFGKISSMGGFTPGFFPFRDKAKNRYANKAKKIVKIIQANKRPPISNLQNQMFSVMYKKMSGVNIFRHMINADYKSDVTPPKFKLNFIKNILRKNDLTNEHIKKIASMMKFEYTWWVEKGWLKARSFKQLVNMENPGNFNQETWLLKRNKN